MALTIKELNKEKEMKMFNSNISYLHDKYGTTKIVFYDTETTGFDPTKGDRMIQFAGVEYDLHQDKIVKEINVLINPEGKSVGDSYQIHRKSNKELEKQPLFIDLRDEIVDFLKDSCAIAYNDKFDIKFINFELQRSQYPFLMKDFCETLDGYLVSRSFFAGQKGQSLDAFMERMKIDGSEREAKGHDALLDCQLLAEAFASFLKKYDLSLMKDFDPPLISYKKLNVPQHIKPLSLSAKDFNDKPMKKEENTIKMFGKVIR